MNFLYKWSGYIICFFVFVGIIILFAGMLEMGMKKKEPITFCIKEIKINPDGKIMLISEDEVLIANNVYGKIQSGCIKLKKEYNNSYTAEE